MLLGQSTSASPPPSRTCAGPQPAAHRCDCAHPRASHPPSHLPSHLPAHLPVHTPLHLPACSQPSSAVAQSVCPCESSSGGARLVELAPLHATCTAGSTSTCAGARSARNMAFTYESHPRFALTRLSLSIVTPRLSELLLPVRRAACVHVADTCHMSNTVTDTVHVT